jgi:hypothetical protein
MVGAGLLVAVAAARISAYLSLVLRHIDWERGSFATVCSVLLAFRSSRCCVSGRVREKRRVESGGVDVDGRWAVGRWGVGF